jgi:RimJ/RimL family protein N-acetyltransferase
MKLIGLRVILRPLERRDLERSRAWVNDPEIAALLLRVLPVSELEQEKWFENICTHPDRYVWAVEIEGQHIGNVGLYAIDLVHRRAEAWTLLGEAAWRGKGLGQEAMALLLDYGFGGLSLNKIYLHVDEDNIIAQNMYKKLGFLEEGLLVNEYFIEGRFRNIIRMRLLVSERPTLKKGNVSI